MILAIDIGGTKIAAAQVDRGVCNARKQTSMPKTEADFMDVLEQLVLGRDSITKVAVAVTGYLDDGRIRSVNHQIIPFWDGFPLVERLWALTGLPVLAINDAQAAAWGEYSLREHRCKNVLFVTLSTGVGGGLILDGKLRSGGHGLAGHIGHSSVHIPPVDTPAVCGCGRWGCLEAVASGTALARQATKHFQRSMSSADLFALAHSGDAQARAILLNAADAVAQAIANAHSQMDLDMVIVGGSVGLAEGMLGWIQSALHKLPSVFQVPIERAALEADAGLVGAAAWLAYLEQNRD